MNTNEVPTLLPTGSTSEPTADADAVADDVVADPTGQLLLLPVDTLPESNAHARFRLSKETRESGLRHVAQIRAQLAAAKDRSDRSNVVALPPRREPAA